MPDFVWKAGDSGPSITDTLTAGGETLDVENTTLEFRLRSLTDANLVALTGTAEFLNVEGDVIFNPSTADTSHPVGNYLAEWVLTNQFGQQQTFPTEGYMWGTIEPTAASAPQMVISPLDVKNYLNIPATDRTRDAELAALIRAVTPLIEAEVGPLVPRTYEEWHDGGSNVIMLDRDPAVGFGTNPSLTILAASEYRGPIEYPLALVASPAFGSIYSVMLVPNYAALTRRTAGGRTLAFMPGREAVHVLYSVGQNPIPENVKRAAVECVRTLYRWPQQTGRGSLAPADLMEVGSAHAEVSRIVRMWIRPTRRYPSFA